jgi:uncharacterized protein (TIGR02246 family)
MKKTLFRVFAVGIVIVSIVLLSGSAPTGAGKPKSLSKADQAAVEDLAKRFVDAINRKDINGAMACVWNSPDMIFVSFGTVIRGYDGFRSSLENMFAQNEEINLAVREISYVPAGNSVMAVGTATFDLQPKNGGPRVHIAERWTDVERKIDGRWVYVLDHTTLVPE